MWSSLITTPEAVSLYQTELLIKTVGLLALSPLSNTGGHELHLNYFEDLDQSKPRLHILVYTFVFAICY